MDKIFWIALNLMRFYGKKAEFSRIFESLRSGGRIVEGEVSDFSEQAAKELEEAHSLGVQIIPFDSPRYPKRLKEIPDPPVLLYVKGDLKAQDNFSVAVVGSRKCTPYGKRIAYEFSKAFASSQITVVSGLALGIDSAAHRGAIDANGRTIAVLGSGIDRIYPASNAKLASSIVNGHGAVVSEFPFGTKPNKFNFPFRNRIISGISLATVVVEAAEKSGSLITARLAGEQGRDVFAVPGNITSKMSAGTNALIKDGAYPITAPSDLFAFEKELSSLFKESNNKGEELSSEEKLILSFLENSGMTPDKISEVTGIPLHRVVSLISYLEVKGFVGRRGGRYFKLK